MSDENTPQDEQADQRDRKLLDDAWRQVEEARQRADEADALDPTVASPETSPELPAPRLDSFTGYKITREIHRGGQGVVYQAIQESTKRKVAIKVMREGPFAGSVDRARFEREVRILGQLKHPNIVGVHDTGTRARTVGFPRR